MKITFLCTSIPNPRNYKRIAELSMKHEVSVVCVRRTNQDIFALREDLDVTHHIIEMNMPSIGHIIRRLKAFTSYSKYALAQLKEISPDVIYTEGMDSLMIVNTYNKYKKVQIVYEVADLRECFIKGVKKSAKQHVIDWLICRKELKLFKNISLLIVTSIKFYEVHYKEFFPRNKVLELPNMPSLKPFENYKAKDHTRDFTVGFIGGFRYPEQMKLLVNAAKISGVKVIFAGGAADTELTNLVNEVSKEDHVEFLGKYDYDKDISRLYGMVDCVYSVYDADNPNVRIALPNKLYESTYCGLPIIVAKNTYLSELVSEWGVGMTVEHNDKEELAEALIKLKEDTSFYFSCVNACESRKQMMDVNAYLHKLSAIIDNNCLKVS